jgi:transposase-like protein
MEKDNIESALTTEEGKPIGNVIRIDEDRIRGHLDRIVRSSVEETLNGLLDAEADRLVGADRYERNDQRRDYRSGHYERKLHTKAGEVTLKVPKLRGQTLDTAIIERYRRRESSVEEALMEMYLAGVSVRRVEDITEALWGTRVSPSTVSDLNKKIYARIEEWRNAPIMSAYPYVYLDGIVMKRTWAGEVRNVSLLVAIGVNAEGYRDILGICEGAKEDRSGWSGFLKHLKERGLKGVELIISDACMGLVESAAEFFPDARWQRCTVHFYRNVFSHVPATKVREVATMLKAIHAAEDVEAARERFEVRIDAPIALGVFRRVAPDPGGRADGIGPKTQERSVSDRNVQRRIAWNHFEAESREFEFANDGRRQHRGDIGARGDATSRRNLFGHGGAADDVPPLDDKHA